MIVGNIGTLALLIVEDSFLLPPSYLTRRGEVLPLLNLLYYASNYARVSRRPPGADNRAFLCRIGMFLR